MYDQWCLNINLGVHSRFDIGVRLAVFPGQQGDTKLFNASFDRITSGKFILIKEKKVLPQISFGMQDIVGTRYHNSTYFVSSKDVTVNKTISLKFNLGYGTKLNDLVFGDAGNHHFIGFFGGAEVGLKKWFYLMAEYDARDINAECKLLIRDWLKINFSLLKMEIPSAGLSLKFTI
jgi:hypothetical protein